MSTPSERIHLIRTIAEALSQEEWTLIDLTLGQFGLPTSDRWEGNDEKSYIIQMTSNAPSETLKELASHLGHGDTSVRAGIDADFWTPGCFRLFASHLSQKGAFTASLKEALSSFGISTFVAHMDITPTREWENEIQLALSTADALVALLHPGFHESSWTDQEVGFVLGRGRLAVAVRLGEVPYGFVGRIQAFDGREKTEIELAKEIFFAFVENKQTNQQMALSLMNRFEESDSFRDAQRNSILLEGITYWEPRFEIRLRNAIKRNGQIQHANGVKDRINRLINKWNPPTPESIEFGESQPEDIPFE